MKVFIDTGGFAALYYPKDPYHVSAVPLWRRLTHERWQFYTTNYIVVETVTLLRNRSGYLDAHKFGEAWYSSALAHLVRVTETHDQQAWEIFKKYADHDFSFVDCSSFAVMRDLGISKAFAFDHHFSVMGFERLEA